MSQIRCPYCGSVQVKAMSNQPKKYPRPVDPIALADWQKGYDCKKCGNDFVVRPVEPKKPVRFFGKLVKWIVILLIALMALAYFLSDETPSKPNKEASIKTESPTKNENPHDQEFSKEAEEAAHAYIPPLVENKPNKSISHSQDQNDTLSIKTTTSESE